MPLRVNCPGCQAPYVLPDATRGKQVRCKQCQQVFAIPAGPPAGGDPPAPPAEERLQTRPARREPAPAAAPPAPAPQKKGGVPCALAVVAVLFALCAGAGLGATGTFLALLPTKPTVTANEPLPQAVAQAEAPKPAAVAPAEPPLPPPVAPPKGIGTAPEPKKAPTPEPAAEPEKLPIKATAGRVFRYNLPGLSPSARCELAAGPPGLAVLGRGLVSWFPAREMVGTQEFSVRVTEDGQTSTRRYQVDVVEDPNPVAGIPPDMPRPNPVRPPARGGADAGVLPDQATLPARAVVGKPFSFQFPNGGGTVKYEVIPQQKQKYKGLDVSPDGLLTWTPPAGTPSGPFRLMVMAGGRFLHYNLEIEEDSQTTLPLPAPAGWVMLADNVTLIAALPAKAQLVYVDTVAVKETRRIDLDFKPALLAVQGDALFAAAEGTGVVHVLDAKTGEAKKEFKVSDSPIVALACHPTQGPIFASNNQRHIVVFDPGTGTARETRFLGMFLAVDPVKADAVYAGIQGEIKDVLEFREAGGGRFTMRSGKTGDRALLVKYAVKDDGLQPLSANANAAVNGRVLRVSPDGKKVGIVGGGGYRPPPGGAGNPGSKGYGIALFSTDDVKAMVGEVECGTYPSNLAFHPVLDLGVAEQGGIAGGDITFHLFNSKSLVETGTIPLASGQGPPQEHAAELLTFGARGTKLVFHDVRSSGSFLRLLPLQLSDKDREALEKAYGK